MQMKKMKEKLRKEEIEAWSETLVQAKNKKENEMQEQSAIKKLISDGNKRIETTVDVRIIDRLKEEYL